MALTASLGIAAEPADRDVQQTPNILFAIADDWGHPHASAYGTKWVSTPAFDRVSRDGLLFTHAYTPNAKCAPSRACILTGRNSWQLEDAANHLCFFPAKFRSWPEVLGAAGWHVGYTRKGWGPGVAQDANGKPRQMTGKPYNAKTATPPTPDIAQDDYAANFDDFLAAAPEGKPWCFWYGALEPHRNYEFGSGAKLGNKSPADIPRVPAFWPDNETVRNDMLDYALEIEHFDTHLGRMLASLERRGLLDNTLVIVTSDHGMPFPRGKGGAYEASNHVPLAISWKAGVAASGRTIDDYVSFIDFAPTLLELAGIPWDKSGMAPSPGRSLTKIFRSTKSGRVIPERDHVLIGMERHDIGRPHDGGYPIRGIVRNDVVYLHNFETSRWPACNPETGYLNVDQSPTKSFILEARRADSSDRFWALCFGKRPADELYHLRDDPDCVQNLVAETGKIDDAARTEMAQLREQLFAELRAQDDPRMFGRGHVFDEYLHSNEAHRGFYERDMSGEKLKAGWVLPTDFEPKPLD
ncbi:MAG: sulfatase [Pirellulales bacterium]